MALLILGNLRSHSFRLPFHAFGIQFQARQLLKQRAALAKAGRGGGHGQHALHAGGYRRVFDLQGPVAGKETVAAR